MIAAPTLLSATSGRTSRAAALLGAELLAVTGQQGHSNLALESIDLSPRVAP